MPPEPSASWGLCEVEAGGLPVVSEMLLQQEDRNLPAQGIGL